MEKEEVLVIENAEAGQWTPASGCQEPDANDARSIGQMNAESNTRIWQWMTVVVTALLAVAVLLLAAVVGGAL